MMQKSLEDFLISTGEDKNYELDGRKICLRMGNVIAKSHVNITRIFIENIWEGRIELNIEFKSPDEKIYSAFFAQIARTEKITYDWSSFFKEIQSSVKRDYKENLRGLYKKYFDYCINAYLKTNCALLAKCGWIRDEFMKVFLPVTFPREFANDNCLNIEKDLFNGKFISQSTVPDNEEFLKKNNNLEKLFSILFKDPCMLTVFSYSVHAILWDYIHGYNCRELQTEEIANGDCIFSLCIYGKDPSASKILANLLANFFNIDHKKWATIQRKYHVSSTSISQKTFDRLFRYKSVPIIITSKTNRFTKASSIIKKLHQKREDLLFHCYPVYISTSPVLTDEMINCCSDSIAKELRSMDYNDFDRIHYQFCYLLYQFIAYLSINRTDEERYKMHLNREGEQYMEMSIFNLLERPIFTEEWLDTHMPNIYLCSTMDFFCYYLRNTPLRGYADRLREFSEICFLPDRQTENQTDNPKYEQLEIHFLDFLRETISKNLKTKNESWLWEGKEARGEKEECYYLKPEEGCEMFNKTLEKNSIPPFLRENS